MRKKIRKKKKQKKEKMKRIKTKKQKMKRNTKIDIKVLKEIQKKIIMRGIIIR